MRLTQNEKKVLKLLVKNAKLSDTTISNKLNISSQAVGKMRRKLEEEVIKGYTVELDFEKLGISSLSLIDATYEKDLEKEVKENLPSCPKIINVFKFMNGTSRLKVIRLNSGLDECENCSLDTCKLINISEINTIPITNVIKSDMKPLMNKIIENFESFPLGKLAKRNPYFHPKPLFYS